MRLTTADYLLLLLAILVTVLVLRGLRGALARPTWPAEQQARAMRRATWGAAGWLLLTGALAASGFLRQWNALPPHLLLVLLPPLLLTVFLLRSRRVGTLLDALPLTALIVPQVFRVAVELLLWLAYREGRIPGQMTFEGRNWDVFVGLTAPLVAWLLRRNPRPALAIAWNVAGLLVLGNIVVVAILSAPLPFRRFWNEPANTVIADFPWVWLPGVLVPIAYGLHVLSLRQALRRAPRAAPR